MPWGASPRAINHLPTSLLVGRPGRGGAVEPDATELILSNTRGT